MAEFGYEVTMEEWENQFLREWWSLNPSAATLSGIHDYDGSWDDFGKKGLRAKERCLRKWRERTSDSTIRTFFSLQLESYAYQEYYYDLGVLASTFQTLIQAYQATLPEYRAARYRGFPAALQGYISVLREGLHHHRTVSTRQVEAVLAQCEQYHEVLPLTPFVDFLQHEYLPSTTAIDAVGEVRYQRAVRQVTGNRAVDLAELYEWAYSEVARVKGELAQLPRTAEELVYSDVELFPLVTEWLQESKSLFAPYFTNLSSVPLPALRGNALGAQTSFQPPNIINYPSLYPASTARELSTIFHEGIPGHYLAYTREEKYASPLFKYLIAYPLNTEGWALYCERLAEEVGIYHTRPSYYLRGRYLDELLRCYRIILDIGLHVAWENPATGRVWDYEQAVTLLQQECELPRAEAEHEVTRYLALPGQALCYKLGERLLLARRDEWQGTLRDFHEMVLAEPVW